MTRRNDKCPCGSGKKYKNCCMQADQEKARLVPPTDRPFEERTDLKVATWVIFVVATAVLGVISGVLWFLDYVRIAGTVFGIGMFLLLVYVAFRNVPTLRKQAGDGGNIDFGN